MTLRLAFASGETALIHVSWLHPYKEHRLSVIGSAGMAVFDDTLPWDRKLQLYPHQVSLDGASPQVVRAEPVAAENRAERSRFWPNAPIFSIASVTAPSRSPAQPKRLP